MAKKKPQAESKDTELENPFPTEEQAATLPDLGGANVNEDVDVPAEEEKSVRSVVSELPSSRKKKTNKKADKDDLDFDDRDGLTKGIDSLSESSTPVESFKHIPTGVVALDKVTNGGWPRPLVIESYSEEGVAKTTIALMTCKMVVLVLREHAIFLDYEKGVQLVYLDQLGIPYANLTVTDEDLRQRLGDKWQTLDPERVQGERVAIRKERITNALKSKRALLWIFSPMTYEEGWNILRTLQEDVLPRPAAYAVIDSYAAMRPSMEITFGGRPMQQGMMGSEFLTKIVHHLMKWDSVLHILNHLKVDVGRMMWDKSRPSYMPPPKKSYSSDTLKFVAQLRTMMKKTKKIEVDAMDTTQGEKKKVAIGHYVLMTQEKQKMHVPLPCQFLVSYGQGVDNIDLIIILAVQKKVIIVKGQIFELGDWAPPVVGKGGKTEAQSFRGRRELRDYLSTSPAVLRTVCRKLQEAGEYLPLDSLLEIRDDYDPQTHTLREPPLHFLYETVKK